MKYSIPWRNYEAGFDVEEKSFTWIIRDFPSIRRNQSSVKSQKMDFTAGETTGHLPTSTWSLWLDFDTLRGIKDERWIGIYYRAKNLSKWHSKLRNSFSEMTFGIQNEKGKITYKRATGQKHIPCTFGDDHDSCGKDKFIDADNLDTFTEENLVIHCNFKLYVLRESETTNSLQAIKQKFIVQFIAQAREDLADLLANPIPSTAIKIVSNDKKEFSRPREILAARSEVFAAMLRSNMTEANSGVLQLPDMSSKALEVLLDFLYHGELHPQWNRADVIVELTNAAGKYQLHDLLQFLDLTLGKVCQLKNVGALVTLAHQLSLKVAEEELILFVRREGLDSADTLIQILNTELPLIEPAPTANSRKSRKRKRTQRSIPSRDFVIETGFDVEEQSFTWTIQDFPLFRKNQSMVDSQTMNFTAGENTGHHPNSTWTVYLDFGSRAENQKRWIGIYYSTKNRSMWHPNLRNSYAEMTFAIQNEKGKRTCIKATGRKYVSEDFIFDERCSNGSRKFIDVDNLNTCTEKNLVIHCNFKLYVPSETTNSLQTTTKEFQVKFAAQAWKDLAGVRKNPIPSTTIKIVSNDNKEFSRPREILAARSEVFAAMLRSNMTEANSGVLQLPDMSSKALEVLLDFLYPGKLHPEWNRADVIVELTNAAGKYQLHDLLQFLDLTLGKICQLENVGALVTLAHQLSLKVAEVELILFVRREGLDSVDDFIQMWNTELPVFKPTPTDNANKLRRSKRKLNL